MRDHLVTCETSRKCTPRAKRRAAETSVWLHRSSHAVTGRKQIHGGPGARVGAVRERRGPAALARPRHCQLEPRRARPPATPPPPARAPPGEPECGSE